MSKENVIQLLECMINKVPYVYKNENEDTEIEILYFDGDAILCKGVFNILLD